MIKMMIYLWTNGPPVWTNFAAGTSASPLERIDWPPNLPHESTNSPGVFHGAGWKIHEDSCHFMPRKKPVGPFDRLGGIQKTTFRMWDFLDQLYIQYISIWYLWVHPDIAGDKKPPVPWQLSDGKPMMNHGIRGFTTETTNWSSRPRSR